MIPWNPDEKRSVKNPKFTYETAIIFCSVTTNLVPFSLIFTLLFFRKGWWFVAWCDVISWRHRYRHTNVSGNFNAPTERTTAGFTSVAVFSRLSLSIQKGLEQEWAISFSFLALPTEEPKTMISQTIIIVLCGFFTGELNFGTVNYFDTFMEKKC